MENHLRLTKQSEHSLLCLYFQSDKICIYDDAVEIQKSFKIAMFRRMNISKRILRSDINSICLYTSKSFYLLWFFAILSMSLFTIGVSTEIWSIAYVGLSLLFPFLIQCLVSLRNYHDMTNLKIIGCKSTFAEEIVLTQNDANVIINTLIPVYSDIHV